MPRLDGLHFPSIDETDRGWPEREFDREDFLKVIRHQGLMSLLWLFSNSVEILWRKMFWHFFNEVFSYCSFGKSLNALFVSLIPQEVGAWSLKDFRTISLLGSLYKILANVLANRLVTFATLIPRINFLIPDEFNDDVEYSASLFSMLPKVILEEF